MSDKTFVPIGSSITVVDALDATLGVLADANLASYRMDSDADWRLLHIRCKASKAQPAWAFSLENEKVAELQKIYDDAAFEYDPPRIVDRLRDPVFANPGFPNSNVYPPHFIGPYDWGDEPVPDSEYSYPHTIQTPAGYLPLVLRTQWQYHVTHVQEIGTYILPLAYHRTTAAGVQMIQIARSDMSFWPMPPHAVWSRFEKVVGLEGATTLPP